MQRITISLDDTLAEALDDLLRSRAYQSRSEGIRDLVRETMNRWQDETVGRSHCVANLSYIYNGRVRALASSRSTTAVRHAARPSQPDLVIDGRAPRS